MSNQDPDKTGETTADIESSSSSSIGSDRLPVWLSLCIFSATAVAALETETRFSSGDTTEDTAALAFASSALALSFLGVILSVVKRGVYFVGNLGEVILVVILLGVWGAATAIITNPENDIAVSQPRNDEVGAVITNANLYFSAWFAVVACVFLIASLTQQFISKQQGFAGPKTPTAVRCCCLAASSLVVVGSAVRFHRDTDSICDETIAFSSAAREYCRRIDVALSVGAVSSALAVVVGLARVCRRQKGLPLPVEAAASFLLLALWGCGGFGYITRRYSPGSSINNLFFGTWASFVVTIFWFGDCLGEWTYGKKAEDNGEQQDQPPEENELDPDNCD